MTTTTKWKLQDLPAKDGYPNWTPYAIRDAKTNVCIAIVGDVDRYFEGKRQKQQANLIVAAPELLKACKAIASLAKGQGRLNLMEVAGQAHQAVRKATSGK